MRERKKKEAVICDVCIHRAMELRLITFARSLQPKSIELCAEEMKIASIICVQVLSRVRICRRAFLLWCSALSTIYFRKANEK